MQTMEVCRIKKLERTFRKYVLLSSDKEFSEKISKLQFVIPDDDHYQEMLF